MTKEALERAFVAGADWALRNAAIPSPEAFHFQAQAPAAFDDYWTKINEEMANGGPNLAPSVERSRDLMADYGARHGGTLTGRFSSEVPKETNPPRKLFDFDSLPRPGDRDCRSVEEYKATQLASENDECAANGCGGCNPINTRMGRMCEYCGKGFD